jgi:hypothetical protein
MLCSLQLQNTGKYYIIWLHNVIVSVYQKYFHARKNMNKDVPNYYFWIFNEQRVPVVKNTEAVGLW